MNTTTMSRSSDLTSLDTWLASIQAKPKTPAKPKVEIATPSLGVAEAPIPDALVMVTILTKCESCGREHRHPSPRLLLRYGTHTRATSEDIFHYRHLPRERQLVSDSARVCEWCFCPPSN